MIEITGIVPSECEWLVMAHCSVCARTVIYRHPFLIRTIRGAISRIEGMCVDEHRGPAHNEIMEAIKAQKRLDECP